MFSTAIQHFNVSVGCSRDVLTSVFALLAPGFVLSLLAAIIGALVLLGGDPTLAASLFIGER
jgi:hypothetical protein